MIDDQDTEKRIDEIVRRFPKVFGLSFAPGQTFTIERETCHVDDTDGETILLRIMRMEFGQPLAFAYASEEELRIHLIQLH